MESCSLKDKYLGGFFFLSHKEGSPHLKPQMKCVVPSTKVLQHTFEEKVVCPKRPGLNPGTIRKLLKRITGKHPGQSKNLSLEKTLCSRCFCPPRAAQRCTCCLNVSKQGSNTPRQKGHQKCLNPSKK